MSFRRDKEKTRKWQTWLDEHRRELLECGVPDGVLQCESHWMYFLEHGYFQPVGVAEPIITIDRMERAQLERLCIFLEQDDYYPGCSTLNGLQYELKRGRHANTPDSDERFS